MLMAANDTSLANALPFTDLVVNGRTVQLCGGFAVRRDDAEFRDAMSGVLEQMKTDGRLRSIYTRFDFLPGMIPEPRAEPTTASLCQG